MQQNLKFALYHFSVTCHTSLVKFYNDIMGTNCGKCTRLIEVSVVDEFPQLQSLGHSSVCFFPNREAYSAFNCQMISTLDTKLLKFKKWMKLLALVTGTKRQLKSCSSSNQDCNVTGGLEAVLHTAVSARVMVRWNTDTACDLVNGTIGRQPQRTSSRIAQNCAFVFCCLLIVISSYTTVSFRIFTNFMHPSQERTPLVLSCPTFQTQLQFKLLSWTHFHHHLQLCIEKADYTHTHLLKSVNFHVHT